MNHSQAAWEPLTGPLLSLRAPRLPLFAPDNTAGIVPQPPFVLIKSPGTIQLFRAGPHTGAFMAAGLIKTSSPHHRQIMYIISGRSTKVLLPNERLAAAGAWLRIFNIFLSAPVATAIMLRLLIRFRFEKFQKISYTFCVPLLKKKKKTSMCFISIRMSSNLFFSARLGVLWGGSFHVAGDKLKMCW